MRKLIYALVFVFVLALTQTVLPQVNWLQSPGPVGGEVRCIAVDSSGYTYFGSNGAGIFKSINLGANWSKVKTGILNLNVRAMAINSSGHIYAATFDSISSGIIRSTNNGLNWNNTALTNADVLTLAVNPSGDIFAGTDTNGVYRSTNGGVSFTQVNNGLTFGYINSIAIKTTGEIFIGTRYGGVFRSTNNGDNWAQVNTGGLTNAYVNAIAVNPVNGDIFCGTGNGGYNGAVYRSTNNGEIWTIMALTNAWVKGLVINNNGKIYVACLSIYTYGYSVQLYKSTNGGGNFSPEGTSEWPLYYTSLAYNNTDGNIYIGTNVSLYKSTNDGVSFSRTDAGFTGQYIRSLVYYNGHILAGCMWRGISSTSDGGINWSYTYHRFTFNAFALNSAGGILAGGQELANNSGHVTRSWGGLSWYHLPFPTSTPSVLSLALNYLDYIFVGTAGSGIFRSINHGLDWTQIDLSNNNVYALTSNSSNFIFAGTRGGKIFRSTDDGYNWSQVYSSPIGNNYVKCLTIKSNNVIYAGLDSGGIIISTNDGVNWTQSSFTVSHVNAITFNSGGYIFVGTGKTGVYESTDNGVNWMQINTGLANTQINTLVFDNNQYLYCGTNGNSVYKSSMPIIGIQNTSTEIPAKYSLSQNYPNPFNPTTKIKFQVKSAGVVKLVVLDILGKEVAALVNEKLQPGTYETTFDGSNLTSGIYFYRLTIHHGGSSTNNIQITRKCILLK